MKRIECRGMNQGSRLRMGARLDEHSASSFPLVSIMAKEKNYLDGSINPSTNACDGGRNWSTRKNSHKHREDMGRPGFTSGTFLL